MIITIQAPRQSNLQADFNLMARAAEIAEDTIISAHVDNQPVCVDLGDDATLTVDPE